MRRTWTGSLSERIAARLLSSAQQAQATAMAAAPATEPDHSPRAPRSAAPRTITAAERPSRTDRCSPNARTASAMVNGASRLSSSDPARPLTRERPHSISTGPRAAPAITAPARMGASARVSRASAARRRATRKAAPAPRYRSAARVSGLALGRSSFDSGAPRPKSKAAASPSPEPRSRSSASMAGVYADNACSRSAMTSSASSSPSERRTRSS